MKIKFQLTKFEQGLSFQVLNQTDKWLNVDNSKRLEFKYSMNLKLVSEHVARFNLNQMELHLWGSYKDKRTEIASTIFPTNAVRDEWHDYILETIEDWANNAEDFKEENNGSYQIFNKTGNDIYEI